MEIVDEFSMFLLNILILDKFNKFYNNNTNNKNNKKSLVLLNNLTIFSLNFSFIYYLINKSFNFFLHFYGVSIVIIVLNLYLNNINNTIKFKTLGSLLCGKFFWQLEQNLCYMFYPIFIFHSLWHFFTALSCYYIINVMYIIEFQKNKNKLNQ